MQQSRSKVLQVLRQVQLASSSCPWHSNHHHGIHNDSSSDNDYAFELATSTIRYGKGITREVGMDVQNLKSRKVVVFTDSFLKGLLPVQTVIESLEMHKQNYVVYDRVKVEPTDISIRDSIEFVKKEQPDAFIAVGGGSVIDTAKAANLYLSHPDADLLDFVNAPLGKAMVPYNKVFPLIAIPTTAGTGSETTGVSIFDYTPKQFKTGIASRVLKPYLGMVDPVNTRTMPPQVHVSTGLDVLCHSMESYTAIPYDQRPPRPSNPKDRPSYQGANPISDVWSLKALKMCIDHLPRAYRNPDDHVAQEQMILASTFAGIGFSY
jgi:hydroxyacid-oxoacid transhydrogenase